MIPEHSYAVILDIMGSNQHPSSPIGVVGIDLQDERIERVLTNARSVQGLEVIDLEEETIEPIDEVYRYYCTPTNTHWVTDYQDCSRRLWIL